MNTNKIKDLQEAILHECYDNIEIENRLKELELFKSSKYFAIKELLRRSRARIEDLQHEIINCK